MSERYVVHKVFNGSDQVAGSFTVSNGAIHFDSMADEMNCSMFPSGPMNAMTRSRLQYLLNNYNKAVYLVRG